MESKSTASVPSEDGKPAMTLVGKTAQTETPPPPPPPLIPRAPTVDVATVSSVKVSWLVPENSNGAKNYHYEVQRCKLSDGKEPAVTELIYSGIKTSCECKELLPGTKYSFRVRATHEGVTGQFSPHCKIETECVVPTEPVKLTLAGKKKTHMVVKWNQPTSEGGTKIVSYTLLGDDGDDTIAVDEFKAVFTGADKRFKINNLDPGRVYRFRVFASNAVGDGLSCEVESFCTAAGAPSIPNPPALKSSSVNSLHLVWAESESNGADISEYLLEMNGEFGYQPVYSGIAREFVVTNLKRAQSYEFRVSAKNIAGTSKPSVKTNFSTRAAVPGPAATPVLTKETLTSLNITCRPSVDDGGSEISGFIVELAGGICSTKKQNVSTEFVQVFSGPDSRHEISRLAPGHAYMCRVACYNKVGKGPFSDVKRFCTVAVPPNAPEPPTIKHGLGSSSSCVLSIHWEAPKILGGEKVTAFRLESAKADTTSSTLVWFEVYVGDLSSFELTGLDPAEKYNFRVAAKNKAGWSPSSVVASAITGAAVPDVVEHTRCDASTSTSLTVVWDPPKDNGNVITNYLVDMTSADISTESKYTKNISSTTASATFKELQPAHTYSVVVTAVNGIGAGLPSNPFFMKTSPAAPAPPLNLALKHVDETSAMFCWEPSKTNGSPIKVYSLQLNGKKHLRLPDECVKSLTHTLTKLKPNEAYKIRLQGSNAVGDSPLSATLTFNTNLVPPPAPTLDHVVSTTSSIKVKWSSPATTTIIETVLQLRNETGMFDDVYRGTAKTFRCSKLAPGKTFEFRCCGLNSAGQGDFGPPAFLETSEAPLPTPQIVTMTSDGDDDESTCVNVMWEFDDDDTKADDLLFELQMSHSNKRHCNVVVTADGDTDTDATTNNNNSSSSNNNNNNDDDDEANNNTTNGNGNTTNNTNNNTNNNNNTTTTTTTNNNTNNNNNTTTSTTTNNNTTTTTTTTNVKVGPQFDTVYVGAATDINIVGFPRGVSVNARVRTKERSGVRLGNFSEIETITLLKKKPSAAIATASATQQQKKEKNNSTDGKIKDNVAGGVTNTLATITNISVVKQSLHQVRNVLSRCINPQTVATLNDGVLLGGLALVLVFITLLLLVLL